MSLRAIVGYKSGIVLAQSGVSSSVTGTTTETILATVAIPAGLMGPSGSLRITTLWSMTNNANAKTLLIRLAGANTGGGAGLSSVATFTSQHNIFNQGVMTSQVMRPAINGAFGSTTSPVITLAANMAASQNLTFTGTLAVPTDTITLNAYCVEVLNP